MNFENLENGFRKYEHTFCNIPCHLIIPDIDAKWTKHNLPLRSVIVDKENNVLSCGWPKFFNHGEKPDCYPNPEKYNDWCIQEKLDGSLVICDFVNDQFSMRTRGTPSYVMQANKDDFELLPQKYPDIIPFLKQNKNLSLLLEIITPNNPIVIRTNEVEFYLLGAIDKNTFEPLPLKDIDTISNTISIPCPKIHQFDTIEDLISIVKNWKGKEGVVLSYNNNKNRIKIKSDWYCWLHRIKSQLNSEANLIEFYINEGMPTYQQFYKIIETHFDWEIAEQLKSQISKLTNAGDKVREIESSMKRFARSIMCLESRKEQARQIISSYGGDQNNRASMVFTLLDGKELNKQHLTKLVYQVL